MQTLERLKMLANPEKIKKGIDNPRKAAKYFFGTIKTFKRDIFGPTDEQWSDRERDVTITDSVFTMVEGRPKFHSIKPSLIPQWESQHGGAVWPGNGNDFHAVQSQSTYYNIEFENLSGPTRHYLEGDIGEEVSYGWQNQDIGMWVMGILPDKNKRRFQLSKGSSLSKNWSNARLAYDLDTMERLAGTVSYPDNKNKQQIPKGENAVISMDEVEENDRDEMNLYKDCIEVAQNGWYNIVGQIALEDLSVNSFIRISLQRNVENGYETIGANTIGNPLEVSREIKLNKGDSIRLCCYQDAVSNASVKGGTNKYSDAAYTYLSVTQK